MIILCSFESIDYKTKNKIKKTGIIFHSTTSLWTYLGMDTEGHNIVII